MNKLIFNEIAIISPASKTAKIQSFTEGINVVTSSKDRKGNWVGKSSLLKSLYHSLGAESLFDNSWESEGQYIYVLSFTFKDKKFKLLRFGRLFKLYNSNNISLFTVANRLELAAKLSGLFGIDIKLKDANNEKKYAPCQPVFWYLLNFTDQTDLKPCEFKSFDRLGSASNFYEDLIYSHLGLRNTLLNDLSCEVDKLKSEVDDLNEKKTIYDNTYRLLKEKNTAIVDEKALKDSLKKYEDEYKGAIEELNKVHQKLEQAFTEKADLELTLQKIDLMIENQKKDIKNFRIEETCSHCGSHLNNTELYYFKRIKDIDGFGMQRISVEEQLALCKRTIELQMDKFNSLKQTVVTIRERISHDPSIQKEGLATLGLSSTLSEMLEKMKEIDEKILGKNNEIKVKNKEIKELTKIKKDIDEYFCLKISELGSKYTIPGFSTESIDSAVCKFSVGGTVNNVAKMIWLSSLLHTRYFKNPNYPVFPLVVDTPNNADFDKENEIKIFNIVFDLHYQEGQVITSLIGFDKNNYSSYQNINVIYLSNEQRRLLNSEDYVKATKEYAFLGVFD